ncbi:MAG: hypothetical protein V3U78_00045 [Thiotrichaceae bacterium]
MSSSLEQHIFVPGLFEPLEVWHRDFEFTPSSPALVKQLSRSKKSKQVHSGLLASVYALLGNHSKKKNSSHAHACYTFDVGETSPKDVLCAAPIELEAGMSDIVVGHSVIDDLDRNECQQLAQLLNNHFSQDGWEFVFTETKVSEKNEGAIRWYLLLPEKTRPNNTVPLYDALGASLRTLVEGTEDVQWSRQLNELQMLLFSSSTNQQRESSRKRSISSFWLWDVDVDSKKSSTVGTVDFIAGGGYEGQVIANAYGLEWSKLLSMNTKQQNQGSGLYIYDDLIIPASRNDLEGWQDNLSGLEVFLADLLDNSAISTTLHSCNGYSWNLKNKNVWSFLSKRKKTLLDFI